MRNWNLSETPWRQLQPPLGEACRPSEHKRSIWLLETFVVKQKYATLSFVTLVFVFQSWGLSTFWWFWGAWNFERSSIQDAEIHSFLGAKAHTRNMRCAQIDAKCTKFERLPATPHWVGGLFAWLVTWTSTFSECRAFPLQREASGNLYLLQRPWQRAYLAGHSNQLYTSRSRSRALSLSLSLCHPSCLQNSGKSISHHICLHFAHWNGTLPKQLNGSGFEDL